ncbi:hypothetical protein ABAC460_18190 [Asticcacaulis sp. AC460]|uniref:biliverdin-producing heme oxygenase n=1 Tax=Asticcacaulis sp. AC460 TaxID=1282360 RepID=UPI0003C404A3|nr:biliverdin-producing heme oxygenase [Asticcacaulis sp. AC460]ESQ87797.1 hypothetical protein ABAC460_18190 [Asticcacaulis sp. AC460]
MPLLDVLRHDTRNQHEALHSHPLLKGLSDDSLTMDGFSRILLAFEAYYRHGEAAFASAPAPQTANAPVLSWLADDFREHDLTSWAHRITFRHPPLDTLSKRVGYLYTKQGSTLGGHVISRHLERHLGLKPHTGQWFFAGYGQENGVRWREFTLWLGANEVRLDVEEAVWGACQAFENIAHFCDRMAELDLAPMKVDHAT